MAEMLVYPLLRGISKVVYPVHDFFLEEISGNMPVFSTINGMVVVSST